MDEEPVLVDEPGLDQRPTEGDAAGDDDVTAVLLLELADPVAPVLAEHGGVLPVRVGEGRGDHDLVHPVQVCGDSGGVVGLVRPIAAEVLEGLPADEEDVFLLALPHHLGVQVLRGGGRVEPVPQELDRAVDGDVLGDRKSAHGQ